MQPGHNISHLDREWPNARKISVGIHGIDLRILMAAAYLHDLINLPKNSTDRVRASTLAAQATRPHLAGLGFSETEIKATQYAIATHSFSGGIEPNSCEGAILRDADRLDAIGAIRIARVRGERRNAGGTLWPRQPISSEPSTG